MIIMSIDEDVDEVDCLFILIHAAFKALVRIEFKSSLHQAIQIASLLHILVDDFNSVDVALIIFEHGAVRLTLARSEIQEGMDSQLDAERLGVVLIC